MRTPRTTVEVRWVDTIETMPAWLRMLRARVNDLAGNGGPGPFTYTLRESLNEATTRQEIVDLYETAYTELAQDFVGHLERIAELEGEARLDLRRLEQLTMDRDAVLWRARHAEDRVEGLLNLIADVRAEPTSPPWENPNTMGMTPRR